MTTDEAMQAVKKAVSNLSELEQLADRRHIVALHWTRFETILAALRAIAPDGPLVCVPRTDYLRLLMAAEMDDTIHWCQTCGAWLADDDPALIVADDYTGCMKAGCEQRDTGDNCRSYRAMIAEGEKL